MVKYEKKKGVSSLAGLRPYHFENPPTASVRLPLYVNEGEISQGGGESTGVKSLTLANTAAAATFMQLNGTWTNPGGEGNGSGGGTDAKLFGTFIYYLLGATFDPLQAKRTLVQNTAEGEEPPYTPIIPDIPTP